MSMETVRDALLCCTVINYGVLLAWFATYAVAREQMQRLWGRWFYLSPDQFDAFSFLGMAIYKVGVLLFNLVPYVALHIVG